MKLNHCYQGDCRDVMRQLIADGVRVQTIVTSPPYWNLRDYGVAGQIGMEPTLQEFVATMVGVFDLARELLADDGTLFLNLGDSYFAGGGRRADPYGTSGKEPAGSQARDCLCGSLCDACRRAYQIGKSHSDDPPVPMLGASIRGSNPLRTGSAHDHLPTLDLPGQADRSEAANPDLGQTADRAGALLPGALESMPLESSLQHPEDFPPLVPPSECQLCGCSLQGSALASARMAGCNCDTAQRGLASDNSGTGAVSSAYPHLTTESLKAKDLCGVPWRVAFALQDAGWYLRQDIIWSKPNPMPESVRDRCTKAHEYLFLLTKSPKYYFDQEAILEPCSPGTHARLAQNVAEQIGSERANGGAKTNGNMKAVSRGGVDQGCGQRQGPPGNEAKPRKVYPGTGVGFGRGTDAEQRGRGRVKNNESFDAAMAIMPDKRNKRSVWTIATQSYSEAHFATFPEALVEPCLLAGSRPGDIVFDPFMGSGTVAQVAQNLGRKWIGSELNPEYIALQSNRTRQAGLEFAA